VAGAGEALGGLDQLVANADGAAGDARVEDTDADAWRVTLDLNVVHAAVAARAATPLMRAAGGGAMVFIASISGLRPQPRAQYAAAKAAEIHLAASLGRELGPDGIRVNAFPGGGWDKRRASDPEAFRGVGARRVPARAARHGRGGRGRDVLPAVAAG